MTYDTSSPVIACTLSASDFKERVAWISDLNGKWLRSHHRDDLVLELVYAPDARDAVRKMVAEEEACCGFLRFDLHESHTAIRLLITAPEAVREGVELVFSPFQSTTAPVQSAGCSCCGARA